MSSKTKKILAIVVLLLLAVGIGVGVVVVLPRLTTTEESVAPTAPESKPSAAEWLGAAACNTSFTIAGVEIVTTPTATPTATLTSTPTATPTATATPTPTPVIGCNDTCSTNADCPSSLVCATDGSGGLACRNPLCSTSTSCGCGTPAPTSTPGGSFATPTPTVATLPDAGFSLPTIGVLGGGVVLVLLGILLAL